MIFLRRSREKSKYRWFKVKGFGGGGWWVGGGGGGNSRRVRCHKGNHV